MRDAKEWFDQFPGALDWPEHSQWCARHWAPCPILGANGLGAAMELMQIFIAEMLPPEVRDIREKNQVLREASPICCRIGDERMYKLWGRWPPARGVGDATRSL